MKWTNRLGNWLLVGGAWSTTALMLGAAGAGCLARPVGQQPPTTKVNFTSTVSQQAVDKVDLLFAIDNSASMGDKQAILAEAVPNLIEGLVRPRCVNGDEKPDAANTLSDPTKPKEDRYGCPPGYDPEFKPITDMHIGIVSSSLGSFGGDVCEASKGPRMNDRAHLLNFKPGGGEVALAKPSNFLAWFPKTKENDDPKRHPEPANPVRQIGGTEPPNPDGLIENFQEMVIGVEQNGCGLEAQLESVYRFLIQPDPWEEVIVPPPPNGGGKAELVGVDIEVLRQRADFLRPDSLVAVIMLTDEDDSSADPLALAGQGWAFMNYKFPGSDVYRTQSNTGTTAPRGTSACTDPERGPGHADCTSCGFAAQCDPSKPDCQKIKNDPNCKLPGVKDKSGGGIDGYYGPEDDSMNVRFHRMKERYGIDPQYPIKRYVDGFTKFKVPDRKAEHVITGEGPGRQIANYTSTGKCTNPLFASKLPREPGDELCSLPRSTRSPDLIFFAVVGGVPNQLLHFDPSDPEKSRITNDDWTKILGRDPTNFDFSGIDVHMVQSVAPRQGLSGADQAMGSNGNDPVHGREWDTKKTDLQYACTFDLPEARDCKLAANENACDCGPNASNPPLCGPNNTQVKAKAYPTVREFQVVRALGENGIIASLCPIQLTDKAAPDYGYKPAVAAIIDRLKNALTTQCLPQKLREAGEEGEVPCLVLAQLSPDTAGKCEDYGLAPPKKEILDVFLEQQRAESGNVKEGGLNLAELTVCEIPQETVPVGESCKDLTEMKWCYVENNPSSKQNPAGRCPQALIFSSGTAQLAGARFSLQCINQFAAGEASKDTQ